MKKKFDKYTFYDSWQLDELNMKPDDAYLVLQDVGELKQGERVIFLGFDDVDNHYGIFVFMDAERRILEVPGDYSGPNHSHMTDLKRALSKIVDQV